MERMTFGEELLYKKNKPFIGADTILLGFLIIILLLLVSLVSFTSLCLVDGDSMNGTLIDEQYVLLNKSQNANSGDIVVFSKGNENFIKRVIAVGGETIRFEWDGAHVKTQKLIGGVFEDLDESFINDGYMDAVTDSNALYPVVGEEIVVPQDYYFVMGDNRNHSEDSRRKKIGMVSKEQVMGKVIYRVGKGSWDEWLLTLLFSSGMKGR